MALVATALAVGLGAWLGSRPPPPPLEPAVSPPAREDGPAAAAAPALEQRSEILDRIEITETEQFGSEEAARRRRQRERMLDARLGERR